MQRVAEAAGLDPAQFAGHSLRAGLATSAAMAGAEERDIMRQTRHRSVVVARRYIRDGSLFRNNAAGPWGCSQEPHCSGSDLATAPWLMLILADGRSG